MFLLLAFYELGAEPVRSMALVRMAGIGATPPLTRASAKDGCPVFLQTSTITTYALASRDPARPTPVGHLLKK